MQTLAGISGRMHMDYTGLENFDPSTVYVGCTRSSTARLLTVEHLNATTLESCLLKHRRSHPSYKA